MGRESRESHPGRERRPKKIECNKEMLRMPLREDQRKEGAREVK